MGTSITAAGNTYNPCLLLLRSKGYELWVENGESISIWCCRKGENRFAGYTPPELLGIVALWETFGENWIRQTPDALGEITDRAVDC